MTKCHRLGAESSRFPAISATALRRKLLEAIACGCSSRRRRRHAFHLQSPEKPKPKPKQKSLLIGGADRLSELLKLDMSDSGSDDPPESDTTKKKMEAFEALQSAVKRLQLVECRDRRRKAAEEIRRLAKDDADARETLAMLGSIPPLIAMLDDSDDDLELQISSLYALLNLAIGNDMNKAAIVNAGGIDKMMNLLKSRSESNPSICEAIVANFLGLSALDLNKPIIAASGAIPFLVGSFRSPTSSQSKQDSLRAIFNLSILPSNIPLLVGSELVPDLLSALEEEDSSSDRVLSVLSNLVAAREGRKAIGKGIAILIEVLGWIDSPRGQEKAAYVLMVMAHKSDTDRAAMIRCGIRSVLLELVLMGSALAQKRASRMLEMLRVERGKEVMSEGFLGLPAVSAPLMGGEKQEEEEEEEEEVVMMSEERKAVRELVKESLQSNLKKIAKRANLVREFGPSDRENGGFKVAAGTSKSVPF